MSGLITAIHQGDLAAVRRLVEQSGNIHKIGHNAFFSAVECGKLEIVKYLVEHGIDIHVGDDYALRIASRNRHLEITRLLLEHGARVHAYDDDALRSTAANGHLEVVQLLLDYGADPRARNDDAFIGAASSGHLNVVKCLVAHGADVTNMHALKSALDNYHHEMVEYITRICVKTRRYTVTTFGSSVFMNNYKYVKLHIKHYIKSVNRSCRRSHITSKISKLIGRNMIVPPEIHCDLAPVPAVYRIVRNGRLDNHGRKQSNRLRKLHRLYGSS